MTAPKHTPGPWYIDPNERSDMPIRVAGGEGWRVAQCSGISLGIAAEECKANAHLIAAAPDLLAACKAVVSYYQNIGGNPEQPISDRYWIEGALLARAAIAKAEGGAA